MVTKISKHKVFISFHERDIKYKEDFVRMMGKRIVDRSVDTGNIDDTDLKTATVRQKIRDEYIRDAAVAIVLIGPRTWQRKHVDWEIGSGIRKTKKNPRCGLLGILLPNHPSHNKKRNLHLAMLLQASGRSQALRNLLRAEQERSPDFLRLANALTALYPPGSEEKRLLDAMLLAAPR